MGNKKNEFVESLKLFKLYSVLKPVEQKRFEGWVKAELDTRMPELIVLLSHLKKGIRKEDIWEKVNPGKPYHDIQFRTWCRRLTRYVEEYLAFINLRRKQNELNLYLLEELADRKKPIIYQQTIKKAENRLEGVKIKDFSYYRNRYFLIQNRHSFSNHHAVKIAGEIAKEMNKAFDRWWILSKLKLALMNASYQARNVSIPTGFINELNKKLKNEFDPNNKDANEYRDVILIKFYYLAVRIRSKKRKKDAKELWDFLQKEYDVLTESDYRTLFSILLNFYIAELNKNPGTKLYKRLQELYIDGADKKVLFVNKYLSTQHFNNYIRITLAAGDYEAAHNFIDKYSNSLAPVDKENIVLYNRANVLFAERRFKEALNLLLEKQSNIQITSIEMRCRFLSLKCLYELNGAIDEDPINNLLRALKRSDKITGNLKEAYKKGAGFFKKMNKIQGRDDFLTLKEEIEKEKFLLEKSWLMSKINQRLQD